MHCSGPVSDRNETACLHCFARTKKCKIYLGIKTLLLEFLQDAVVGCPQHIVDLGHLVQLIGSREERIQTETGELQQSDCKATKLFTQLSGRHL